MARLVPALACALCMLLVSVPSEPVHAEDAAAPKLGPEAPVTAVDLRETAAHNSPALAADPTDERFVVLANRLDAPEFGCALQVSGDRGRSWLPATPVPELPTGADTCYAPEVAFDSAGTLYYLFVGLSGEGNVPMGVYLTTSSDRATTFTEPRRVLGPHNYQVRMAMDTGRSPARLHLVWLHASAQPGIGGLPATPNPILAAHSDDGGRTFSEPVQVSDPDRDRVVAPALALGPDEAVHVAYYDLGDDIRDYQGLEGPTWPGTWSLVTTSSFDGGERFEAGVVVDDELVPPERVMLIFTMPPAALAADPATGALYTAWHDARHGDWDVFVASSTERGRTWKPAVRVNDGEPGEGGHSYLPQLDVGPNGRVDVVFYDRRHDPANVHNDVFLAWSSDGGKSFAPDLKLTRESSNSYVGQRYLVPSAEGKADFGSRLALHSERSRVVAAWTDTRNVLGGADERGGSVQQDLFAREARFADSAATPDAGGVSTQAIMSGLAVLAAAALALAYRGSPKPSAPHAGAGGPSVGTIRGAR